MTDKEIEKALAQCGNLVDFEREGCPLKGEVLCFSLLRENALAYINRLKAENERLKRSDQSKEDCTIDQHAEIHSLRDEIKQVRKDTAKEILQEMYKRIFGVKNENVTPTYVTHLTNMALLQFRQMIVEEAKKFGVEVEE